MSDVTIPEDVRAKAERVAMNVGAGLALGSTETIARAILDERERCAKLAEGHEQTRDWVPGSLYDTIRREVAQAIRSSHD